MRSTGPRLPPRTTEDAARRLAEIEREVDDILRAFPELRHRSRLFRPPDLPVRQRPRLAAGVRLPVRHRVH
jgi:hypothetical protein